MKLSDEFCNILLKIISDLTKKHANVWEGPLKIATMMKQEPVETNEEIKFSKDVNEILSELQLEKYQDRFDKMPFDVFKTLSDDDLKDLGISLLGPRRKLTQCIQYLRYQDSTKN